MSSPQQGYSFPEDNCWGITDVEIVGTSSSALENIAAPENEILSATSPTCGATQSGLIWNWVNKFLKYSYRLKVFFIFTKCSNNQGSE